MRHLNNLNGRVLGKKLCIPKQYIYKYSFKYIREYIQNY